LDLVYPIFAGTAAYPIPEATRRIKQRQADVIVVGLSLHEDEAVHRAVIEGGANDCVSKNAAANDLAETICRLSR
jgi:DNA-binding NarL/FixJ family response regulator